MQTDKIYIDGKYVDSDLDEWIEVENPATLEVIGRVPRGNEADVDRAAKAAARAFTTYSQSPLEERIGYVERFRAYLLEKKEEIIEVIQEELGVPTFYAESRQFQTNIDRIDAFIDIAKNYEYVEKLDHLDIRHEPIGVFGCLTPWNFPLGQIIQKVIPAVLTGNTIVLKPSQMTPLTAYYVVDGFEQAGLPAGVLNLVTGRGAEVGNAVATHPLVSAVSFTGSTSGGTEVAKKALESVKRITLELGGKSASVFIDDTNLEENVKSALNGVFGNTGQVCAARTRLVVVKEYKEAVEAEIAKQIDRFVVGPPKDPATKVGPLSSRKQFDKVRNYIQIGKQKYKILAGEGKCDDSEGYYVTPIVFTGVGEDDKLAQEEIFGPVLVVIEAEDVEDAIRIANNSLYGLDGAVFGEQEKALEVAKRIVTGSITVNQSAGNIKGPFGGFKQSGFGKEGGVAGFEEYLQIKSLYY